MPDLRPGVRRYWVYVLSCSDGSLYTGYTVDLQKRVALHNAGRASKYTRSRVPVALAYAEESPGLSAALKREAEIKRMRKSEKLLLCSRSSGRTGLALPRPGQDD
ncbi:MAG: GIY-YIG nuclease family protein [Nitrososphaerota archaeon]|jgi:putative endonuclease|nr:GIY-YIG nuclease family protein [Nitrososphaerota archaeon]